MSYLSNISSSTRPVVPPHGDDKKDKLLSLLKHSECTFSEEEVDIFCGRSESFTFSDSSLYSLGELKRVKKAIKNTPVFFDYISEHHPGLISEAFKIRNKEGHLVFPKFADFLLFLLEPTARYSSVYSSVNRFPITGSLGIKLERDLNSPDNCRQLEHLQMLCKASSASDLGLYLIALKQACVDLTKLPKISTKYPIEVYTKLHITPCLDAAKPKALILIAEPQTDYNSAFGILSMKYQLQEIAKEFWIEIKVVKTYDDINNILSEKKDLHLLVFNAHGQRGGMYFSEQSERLQGYLHRQNIHLIPFKNALSPNARILLNSCNTGNSQGKKPPIAQIIADFTNVKVFAPMSCQFSSRLDYNNRASLIRAGFTIFESKDVSGEKA